MITSGKLLIKIKNSINNYGVNSVYKRSTVDLHFSCAFVNFTYLMIRCSGDITSLLVSGQPVLKWNGGVS